MAMADERLLADVARRLRAAGCVFDEDEAAVLIDSAGQGRDSDSLEVMVRRRVAGEPLEVIVGYVDFGGLRLAVRVSPNGWAARCKEHGEVGRR